MADTGEVLSEGGTSSEGRYGRNVIPNTFKNPGTNNSRSRGKRKDVRGPNDGSIEFNSKVSG